MSGKFIPLSGVADTLGISASQTYALVRSGQLPAIKIGGRGQWRVSESALEDYIQRMYAETQALIASRPYVSASAFDARDNVREIDPDRGHRPDGGMRTGSRES